MLLICFMLLVMCALIDLYFCYYYCLLYVIVCGMFNAQIMLHILDIFEECYFSKGEYCCYFWIGCIIQNNIVCLRCLCEEEHMWEQKSRHVFHISTLLEGQCRRCSAHYFLLVQSYLLQII